MAVRSHRLNYWISAIEIISSTEEHESILFALRFDSNLSGQLSIKNLRSL